MEDDHLIQNGATTGKLLALVVLPAAQSTLGAAISQDNYADTNPGADSKKIAYASTSEQSSNPEGDAEVYSMNALDGKGTKNLTNNGVEVGDYFPDFSPDGTRIAYTSVGKQDSNLEGDYEIYVMIAADGLDQTNLSNNGDGVFDLTPKFSPGGKRIAYSSFGDQPSNPEGDYEVYRVNATNASDQLNLSDNGADIDDSLLNFSSNGARIVYGSEGIQPSNLQGDSKIYRMNTLDGLGKKNLTDNKAAYDGFYLPGQS
jgi:dipeptidyl aminopeptidase/acylaminoacyl peptidase